MQCSYVTLQFTKTECLFTLSANSLPYLAEAIYTNSTHQLVKITKDSYQFLAPVAQMVKRVLYSFSRAIDQSSNPPFAELFSPFSNFKSHHIRKAFIFSKNEGNNQKVESKVSGRVRVGVGRAFVPIRWHPFNNLN